MAADYCKILWASNGLSHRSRDNWNLSNRLCLVSLCPVHPHGLHYITYGICCCAYLRSGRTVIVICEVPCECAAQRTKRVQQVTCVHEINTNRVCTRASRECLIVILTTLNMNAWCCLRMTNESAMRWIVSRRFSDV